MTKAAEARENASTSRSLATAGHTFGRSPPAATLAPSGHTQPAARDDTRRIAHEEEDLTLAPLDDETSRHDTSGSKSGVRSSTISDVHLDEQVLSQIEEEIGGRRLRQRIARRTAGGPASDIRLDLRPQVAPAKDKPPVWPWVLSAAAVLVVVALLLIIMLF